MRHQHVVEHQHIPGLPGEEHGLIGNHAPNRVDNAVGNGAAVGVVHIARQVIDAEQFFEHLAHFGLLAGDMEQMRLVEPDGIAGARVALNGLAELLRAQAAVVLPLPLNAGAATVGFDGGALFGVEHLLPGQVEIAVITHIENARGKAFANRFGHV